MKEEITLKKWQIVITLVFTILSVFGSIVFSFTMLKSEVEGHIHDKNVHMPYAEKTKLFVPRTEFNSAQDDTNRQLTEIRDDLREMKKDIKTLLQR